jgi:hypothetical protein
MESLRASHNQTMRSSKLPYRNPPRFGILCTPKTCVESRFSSGSGEEVRGFHGVSRSNARRLLGNRAGRRSKCQMRMRFLDIR